MKFRVTSAVWEESGARIRRITTAAEDNLNSSLANRDFGSDLDQFTIVIVSFSDHPQENERWAKAHRKLATAKHPVTGDEIRYLSIAIPITPNCITGASDEELNRLVMRNVADQIGVRPPRLPKGLNYQALSTAVTMVIGLNKTRTM